MIISALNKNTKSISELPYTLKRKKRYCFNHFNYFNTHLHSQTKFVFCLTCCVSGLPLICMMAPLLLKQLLLPHNAIRETLNALISKKPECQRNRLSIYDHLGRGHAGSKVGSIGQNLTKETKDCKHFAAVGVDWV